jgi:hypothetical protein
MTDRAFVDAHPEIQELARQWISHPEPLSEAGFRPLFPLVEKALKAALSLIGEDPKGQTLIPLLQLCCGSRVRGFNLPFACCDARGREIISSLRAGVMHGEYSRDMQELKDGGWNGTEAEYQKEVLPRRLRTLYGCLNQIVRQVDPSTGRFAGPWQDGRATCASCRAKGLTI